MNIKGNIVKNIKVIGELSKNKYKTSVPIIVKNISIIQPNKNIFDYLLSLSVAFIIAQ